jgi:hypothetical protein
MKWELLDADSVELHHAWQQLPGGPVAAEPSTGESWQYLGTENDEHCFRHRNFEGQGREYVRIPARGKE